MSLALVRHFVRQLTKGKRLVGMTALAASAGLTSWISGLGRRAADVAEDYPILVATLAGATLSVAVLVIGAATLRDERDAGTLPYLFLKPIARWRFALSAWAAAALTASGVAAAGWMVGWSAMGVKTGSWTLAVPALSAYLAAAVGYTAVFVPIGYLFSRAILAGLAYIFVWEAIITSFVTGLGGSSVWRTALSIYAGITEVPDPVLDTLGTVPPGVVGGVVKLAITALVGVALLTWALHRRDAV
jgi:ABC-type transport system involved in multi-copper enzyme maturation permease subunit